MAAAGTKRNAVAQANLQTLPIEILLDIVKASVSSDTDHDPENRINIPGLSLDFPATLSVARTNPAISSSVLDWSYSTSFFSFVSQRDEIYSNSTKPQYAGEALLAWLHKIGEGNRRSIRKLALALSAPELLLLFATAQSVPLLKLPRNMHVWARCLALLKSLQLNILQVTILPGLDEDSPPNIGLTHLQADHRWIVKAVLDSTAHTRNCKIYFATSDCEVIGHAEVEAIKTMTWNMLHSDTFGYHRSDKLAYPNERATTWACQDEASVRPYQIPVVPCRKSCAQKVDEFLPSLKQVVST